MTKHASHQSKTIDERDLTSISDALLLQRIAEGDTHALRHLYESHAGWIAGRLRRKLPPDAVEDVVQETFLAVWRGAGNYRGSADVGGWIWGIARLRMARWYRDLGEEPVGMVDEWLPDGNDLATNAAGRLDLDRAFEALGGPDHEDRRLAEAYFREDRPVKDVARRFGIPIGTVKSRLFRIRRRLVAALEREPDQ